MDCVSISFLVSWKCGFRTKRGIEFDCKFIIYTRIFYKKNDSIFNQDLNYYMTKYANIVLYNFCGYYL